MLIDSHCHLEFENFAEDFDEVLARAKEAGIEKMLSIGTRLKNFPDILKIAEKYEHIYCSFGIHPHEAKDDFVDADYIIKECAHKKVVGIGETGLDYFYEHSPKDKQIASFKEHIIAAQETGLPLIVHTRDAESDTIEIIKQAMQKKTFKGLIHCFTSTQELADEMLALGFFISISGIVTFKKSTDLQQIVRNLPLQSMLVETDAPFLSPVPMRGKRNEPAFTKYTAEFIADLKASSFDEVASTTTANFYGLFTKVAR